MKKYELTRLPDFRPESVHLREPDPPASQLTVSFRSVFAVLVIFLIACVLFGIGGYFFGKLEGENALFESADAKRAEALMPTPMDAIEPSGEELRLPRHLVPIVYRLDMRVFLPYKDSVDFGRRNFTFDAVLQIEFQCVRQTNRVVLNAKQLNIEPSSVALTDASGKNMTLTFVRHESQLEMVEFWFASSMITGQRYTLSMEYDGPIAGDTLAGLYRSKYTENNSVKWLAVTQMQPTDARRMLPCFDEPDMKAQFELTIHHPTGTKAISNAIETIDAEPENEDWVTTKFEPSPKMSSYLLAVAVSEFGYKETITSRGVRMRVWARPSRIDHTDYALSVGPQLLAYYEDYFGIKYPLKKQGENQLCWHRTCPRRTDRFCASLPQYYARPLS
uniref:Aminopeptidase N-like N-terminal domain-containing protein n=1 Tax=Plectus sambesii TaxID=2011161 RepID=A0A914WHK3_9BILA